MGMNVTILRFTYIHRIIGTEVRCIMVVHDNKLSCTIMIDMYCIPPVSHFFQCPIPFSSVYGSRFMQSSNTFVHIGMFTFLNLIIFLSLYYGISVISIFSRICHNNIWICTALRDPFSGHIEMQACETPVWYMFCSFHTYMNIHTLPIHLSVVDLLIHLPTCIYAKHSGHMRNFQNSMQVLAYLYTF